MTLQPNKILVVDSPDGYREIPWDEEAVKEYEFDKEDIESLHEGNTVFSYNIGFYLEDKE